MQPCRHIHTHEYAHIMCVCVLYIPYKKKYWQGSKFGEMANYHATAKFKSRQYFLIPYHSCDLVTFGENHFCAHGTNRLL